MSTDQSSQDADIDTLSLENTQLRKTVKALMARVERDVDQQADTFTLFQTAAKLEEAIKVRTEDLEIVNQRLTHELGVRKRTEDALTLAKEKAEVADKLKTRFLAAASHDLRQPLNSALLFLEAIDEPALPEEQRVFLNKTRIALGSLDNLLGTLLDVTKLDSGMIEPNICHFPVSDVLDPIVSEYSDLSNSPKLSFRYVRSNVVIQTDRHLLETILRNFITNSIRYTSAGMILVGCRRRLNKLRVCVYDTGIGMPAEALTHIFEAYYQVSNSTAGQATGMGLGLSIVDRITALLALERHVTSVPGKGSLFAVDIPLGDVNQITAPQSTALMPANLSNQVLVVIDDSRDVLDGMRANIERWDCRTVFSTDAAEALVELISRDLDPSAILSDFHLENGNNGLDAIDQIRREYGNDNIAILMTSDPNPSIRDQARKLGLNYMTKPLNLAKLRALISRA